MGRFQRSLEIESKKCLAMSSQARGKSPLKNQSNKVAVASPPACEGKIENGQAASLSHA